MVERKKKLREVIGKSQNLHLLYAEHIERRGIELFRLICRKDLEGIVAKRRDGAYSVSAKWIKIKNPNYTQAEGRQELFESRRLGSKPDREALAADLRKRSTKGLQP